MSNPDILRRSDGLTPSCSVDGSWSAHQQLRCLFVQIEFPPKSTRLEFRAEAFSLVITAKWAQPGNSSAFNNPGPDNSNGFSQITYDRNNPRQLQLALKLYY